MALCKWSPVGPNTAHTKTINYACITCMNNDTRLVCGSGKHCRSESEYGTQGRRRHQPQTRTSHCCSWIRVGRHGDISGTHSRYRRA